MKYIIGLVSLLFLSGCFTSFEVVEGPQTKKVVVVEQWPQQPTYYCYTTWWATRRCEYRYEPPQYVYRRTVEIPQTRIIVTPREETSGLEGRPSTVERQEPRSESTGRTQTRSSTTRSETRERTQRNQ